jgi:hypothetical protein
MKIKSGYVFGIRCVGILLLALTMVGCATPPRNIQLAENFWAEKDQKILVAEFKAPTPTMYKLGNQGLLDMAITSIANSGVNQHLAKSDLSWYHELPTDFQHRLKEQRFKVSLHEDTVEGNNKKKTAQLLANADGGKLLTIELRAIGARRSYALGFVPSDRPEAYCMLVGELVDSNDKKVLWRHEAEIVQPIPGAWDQKGYQNLSLALQEAVGVAKQELMDSFFSGR